MKPTIRQAADGIELYDGDTLNWRLTWATWDALVAESLRMRNDGMVKLHVGSRVKWTSQANGGFTVKRGVVVVVVPEGKSPFAAAHHYVPIPDGYNTTSLGGGLGRRGESYIVAVGRKLYWPRANQLSMDLEPEPAK